LTFWGTVIAAVIAAAIIGVATWLLRTRRRIWKRAVALWTSIVCRIGVLTLGPLRRQVEHRASKLGILIPVAARGHNPEIITFNDGSERRYFRDSTSYGRAATAGEFGLQQLLGSYYNAAPTVLPYWSRDELRKWLRQHPLAAGAVEGASA